MNEIERIEKIAEKSPYAEGVNKYPMAYCGEIFKRFFVKDTDDVLELGPAEGVMTDILYPHFSDYTVVDGADVFIKDLKQRYPSIHGYTSTFEDFKPNRKYHNIILGHVLEHVEDPVKVLSLCASWLNGGGRIVSAVPNANSIHRQAAVLMGLLNSTKQLNEADIRNGHRRVYDLDNLLKDFKSANLKVVHSGGYWLKPLSNAQIETNWTMDMINAFLKLGEKYPDIAGEIYVVATN